MRIAAAAAGLFLVTSSAALARTEQRSVPSFDAVRIASGLHATIDIGAQQPVRLDGPDKIVAALETTVEDGTLRVGFPENWWRDHHDFSMGEDDVVQVTIVVPQLRAVAASGGANVKASFTRAQHATLHASGGSEIAARNLDADTLEVHGSGGAVLRLSGRAGEVALRLSGGSRAHARDLSARDFEVRGSGGATAHVRADGDVRGHLSGGSELYVAGRGRSNVGTSGGSAVHAED